MSSGFILFALVCSQAFLHGDGAGDDTDAIQALIDSGRGVVKLPRPAKHYVISRTLRFGDGSGLEMDADTRIRLAPGSDCPLAGNADVTNGNRSITITGGIWDMDNVNQAPNPLWRHLCKPPQPKFVPPARYDPSVYRGIALYFENVSNLVVRGITIRNPVTYAFNACAVSHFTVDGVTFDFTSANPVRGNMDGVHLDGCCHHGRIANLRGTCFDDMVALNANDCDWFVSRQGPISDIEVENLSADYGHSAIRFLSTGDPVERVSVRNVRGHFYAYAIGFTHYFPERPGTGVFTDISIRDVKVGKAPPLEEFPWKAAMPGYPPFFYDRNIRLKNVTIDDFEILQDLRSLDRVR